MPIDIFHFQLTSSECIDVLAAICKMLSLAKLRLCFPKIPFWQITVEQETANEYVGRFLSEMFKNAANELNDWIGCFRFVFV